MLRKIFKSNGRSPSGTALEGQGTAWTEQPPPGHPIASSYVDQDAELAMRIAQEEFEEERMWGSPPGRKNKNDAAYAPIYRSQHHNHDPEDEPTPIDELEVALRESSLHAERMDAAQREAQQAHQAELDRVMAASLSTAAFDEVLRDISFWIRDLDGVCGDVAAAMAEVTALRTELETASTEDDISRAIWLSEQYEQVESRLMELRQRLEPIEEALEAFRSLQTYVRECQPAKAETEEQRDAILAAMFEALGQRGLEALHPFGAWGNTDGEAASYGGDLRGLVQGLIEEARRIPKYPVFGGGEEQTARLSTEQELGVWEWPSVPEFPLTTSEDPVTDPTHSIGSTSKEDRSPSTHFADNEEAPSSPPSAPLVPPLELALPSEMLDPQTPASDGVQPNSGDALSSKSTTTPQSTRALAPSLATARLRRAPRQAVCREPEDVISRMPPLLPLRHQLEKGGWLSRLPKPPATNKQSSVCGTDHDSTTTAPSLSTDVLWQLADRIRDTHPVSVQETCDMVTSILEESAVGSAAALGAAGLAAAAAAGNDGLWPREKWSAAAAITRLCGELGECIDELAGWRVAPESSMLEERMRVLTLLERAARLTARVAQPHDPLRQRLERAGLPWDGIILEEARWAAQTAANAIATAAVRQSGTTVGSLWSTTQVLEPLVAVFDAVFAIDQFAQGLNHRAGEAVTELLKQTTHYARMADPLWVRDTKWA